MSALFSDLAKAWSTVVGTEKFSTNTIPNKSMNTSVLSFPVVGLCLCVESLGSLVQGQGQPPTLRNSELTRGRAETWVHIRYPI